MLLLKKEIFIYVLQKNEWEPFQIVISAGKDLSNVNVSISNFYHDSLNASISTIYLYKEYYVFVNNSSPFPPMNG